MAGISQGKNKEQYNLEKIRDGVWVFRRSQSSPIWQYRITVNTAGRRYKDVSTKQTDFNVACEMAMEAYFSARQLVKINQGHSLFKKSFNDVIDEWFKAFDRDNTKSPNMKVIHRTSTISLKKYFKDKSTNQINDDLCEKYHNWRLTTTTTRGLTPSVATLKQELMTLNIILEYSSKKNYIPMVGKIKLPKNTKVAVGDAFTDIELDLYFRIAPDWIDCARIDHILKRKRITLLSKFIMYSGIRLSEATGLKWDNVKYSAVHKTIFIHIPQSVSKVKKEREVVCLKEMIDVIKELKELSTDDTLFGEHFDGDAPFNHLLNFIKTKTGTDLKWGNDGQRRVLYSFRHTYATKRILEGNVDALVLAENMGTSVHQIQRTYYHGRNSMNAEKLLNVNNVVKPNAIKIKIDGLEDIQMVNYRIDPEAEDVPESDNVPS